MLRRLNSIASLTVGLLAGYALAVAIDHGETVIAALLLAAMAIVTVQTWQLARRLYRYQQSTKETP